MRHELPQMVERLPERACARHPRAMDVNLQPEPVRHRVDRPLQQVLRRPALGDDEGLSDRYVSRLLRLACLAPEVLERLVVHREPSTISIYGLCFVASLSWDEQPGRVFD